MLTLYGAFRSRITRNLWLADELGCDYTHEPVMQAYRMTTDPLAADAPLNTLSPAFLALSPAGAVPVMKDGDFVLSESYAINMHLAETRGGPLAPANAQERALMWQWTLYAATSIEGPALAVLQAPAADTEAIAGHVQTLRRPFAVLNAHLSDTDWLVGGRFTVADINAVETVRFAQANKALMTEFPHIAAWLARAQARPAYVALMARRNAEPAKL